MKIKKYGKLSKKKIDQLRRENVSRYHKNTWEAVKNAPKAIPFNDEFDEE